MLLSKGTEPFRGDMSINSQYEPSIQISNNELIMPERTIYDATGTAMANYSNSNLIINSLQDVNANYLGLLGVYLFHLLT